jgi:hypothetical protein
MRVFGNKIMKIVFGGFEVLKELKVKIAVFCDVTLGNLVPIFRMMLLPLPSGKIKTRQQFLPKLVLIYQTTRCHIQEDNNLQVHLRPKAEEETRWVLHKEELHTE